MPVLDHTSYPAILDAILAHADFDALLALRGASRAYRDRADTLLTSNVTLAPARKAPLADGWPATWPALVALPWGPALPLPPSAVRVLTVPRGVVPQDVGNDLLDALPGLRVLRLPSAPDTFYPVAPVVVYDVPISCRGTLDAEADRVVIHLALEGGSWPQVHADDCAALNVVLWRRGDVPFPAVYGLVLDLLFLPGPVPTLVGADKLWDGVEEDEAASRFRTGVHERVRLMGADAHLIDLDARLKAITFLSYARWLDTLGEDRGALDTFRPDTLPYTT
ncbi:hypothetical protein Q8F55_000034 [Vanrija albida]|uniref:F-box domain-containing protein n=1 Tax=Vanrija albida TaxID=181172 RepID=A0ABR3QC39_9TREE